MAQRGLKKGSEQAKKAGKKAARTRHKNSVARRRKERELRKLNQKPKTNKNGLKFFVGDKKDYSEKVETTKERIHRTIVKTGGKDLFLFSHVLSSGKRVKVLTSNPRRRELKDHCLTPLFGLDGDFIYGDGSIKSEYDGNSFETIVTFK